MKTFLTCLLFAAVSICTSATTMAQLYDVPVSTLNEHSPLVVEGRVLSKYSFWNAAQTRIYTQYQIEVNDALKGRSNNVIDIVRLGGCVDQDCQTLFPRLEMGLGQKGVFFLRPFTKEPLFTDQLYEVVSGPLGFISFQEMDSKIVGANALRLFENLNAEVYIPIAGRPRIIEDEPTFTHVADAAPSITSFFPDTVAAGVRDTLTIVGSEFGVVKGKVWFQNADYPPGVFMRGEAPDIIFWTDTLIQMIVPTEASVDSSLIGVAASGPIRVETDGGMTVQSGDSLMVKYGYRNRRTEFDLVSNLMIFNTPPGSAVRGYSFRMDTTFSDSIQATAIFKKALRDWRCASLVNFNLGSDTTIRVTGRDGVNAVYWDTLDPGVLGITVVDERFCRDATSLVTYYYANEIDLTFAQTGNFYFDSTGAVPITQFDFYSTVIHELGHGHLLQHINRPGFLMHRSLSNATAIHLIHPEILEGALTVMDSSTINHSPDCPLPMVAIAPAGCNSLPIDEKKLGFPGRLILYPVPATGYLNVEMDLIQKLDYILVEITDLSGMIVFKQKMGKAGLGTKIASLDLKSLNSGFFILRVSSDKGRVSKPITIQR
jgi:hypothetical protein